MADALNLDECVQPLMSRASARGRRSGIIHYVSSATFHDEYEAIFEDNTDTLECSPELDAFLKEFLIRK